MSDLITELCQLTAEILQNNPQADVARLVALLKTKINADSQLSEAIHGDHRLIQINQGDAKGFQTLVTGGIANIGDQFQVDGETLQSVLDAFLKTYFNQLSTPQAEKPAELPNNLNRARTGAVNFVGREEAMTQLHHQLQQQERIAITAVVTGMAGVGKTELALQYALHHKKNSTYPGGICWIGVKSETVGLELLQFAKSLLGLFPPEDLNLRGQLDYCWARWQPPGDVLLILDDVHQYEEIQDYLPPQEQRFKVLITTRQHWLAESFEQLHLPVLSESAALALLKSLIGASRLQAELEIGKELCAWLGYLPLGLELVGRFLKRRTNWTLARMQQQLIDKGLQLPALQNPSGDMTAQRGVETAFEVSWEELNQPARDLGCFLSLFALAPIPWRLVVERCLSAKDEAELEDIREEQLLNFHLLQAVEGEVYQFHPLVQQFFQAKLALREDADELRRQFCRGMVEEAKTIPDPYSITGEVVQKITPAIPHLTKVAEFISLYICNQDLVIPFKGLGYLYEHSKCYSKAEDLYRTSLAITKKLFGDHDLAIAESLNNLAYILKTKGNYYEAEKLYEQALNIRINLLSSKHLSIAQSLNNLATVYRKTNRNCQAKALLKKALAIRVELLGKKNPQVGMSLNHLARLYHEKNNYSEAEIWYEKASAVYDVLPNHPFKAINLGNLAELYCSQKRYAKAEPLYQKALEIRKSLLGEEHPDVATSLNDLAQIYYLQCRYEEAEPLYRQAIKIATQALGENHPLTQKFIKNYSQLQSSK